MNTPSIGVDGFGRRAAAHPDDDRAREDGVRQAAEAGQGDGAISRNLFRLDDLAFDETPPGNGTATMPSIEKPPDFLVVLRLRPKHRVDLVVEDRRSALFAPDLPEEVRRRHVHGLDR